MGWKLFLDDVRNPPESFDDAIVARTFREAVDAVRERGVPEQMSLDYDLSQHEHAFRNGKDFLEWFLSEACLNEKYDINNLKLLVFHTGDDDYAQEMMFMWEVVWDLLMDEPCQTVLRRRRLS